MYVFKSSHLCDSVEKDRERETEGEIDRKKERKKREGRERESLYNYEIYFSKA